MARRMRLGGIEDLVDHIVETHETAVVEGNLHRAVLVPEEEWLGLLTTLDLMHVPGMVASIQEAAAEAPESMSTDLPW